MAVTTVRSRLRATPVRCRHHVACPPKPHPYNSANKTGRDFALARHIPAPLYYEVQGTGGLPMILLHSTPDDHRLWLYQAAHFSAWFRTIAVDLAGYGRSAPAQAGVTLADQADAAWQVVDGLSEGPVIVHGNSMGAHIAMRMASARPARVPALILSGCGYLPKRDAMSVWAKRYAEEGLELRFK